MKTKDKHKRYFGTAVFHSSKSIPQVCMEAGLKPSKFMKGCQRMSLDEPIGFRDNAAAQSCLGEAFEIMPDSVRALPLNKSVSSFATDENLFQHSATGISTVLDLQGNPKYLIKVHRGLILMDKKRIPRESVLADHQMISNGATLSVDSSSKARLQCQFIKVGNYEISLYPTGGEAGFMRLRKPTEKDKKSLPEVVLTADVAYEASDLFTRDMEEEVRHLQATMESVTEPTDIEEPTTSRRKGVIRRSRYWTRELLRIWSTRLGFRGDDVVKKTFQSTTQLVPGVECENSDWPKQHHKTRLWPLRPRNLGERCYTDTLIWSYRGKKRYGQLFYLNKSHYVYYYPLNKESDAHKAYQQFIVDIGAPTHFVADNAQAELKCEKLKKICKRYYIKRRWTEAHKQNQNRAERFVQELKKSAGKLSSRMDSDSKYDRYMYEYICYLWNRTACGQLKQRTPYEKLFGETPDISNIRFHWWEPVWYYGTQVKYPKRRMLPGRFVGFSDHTGDECTFLILTAPEDKDQSVISRSVVTPRQPGEKAHGELPRKPSDWSFPSHINPGRGDDGDVEEEKVNPSFTEPEGRKRRKIDPAQADSEMKDTIPEMESSDVDDEDIYGEDDIDESNQVVDQTLDPTPERASMLNLDAVTGYAREPAEGVNITSHKYGRGKKHGQLEFTAARPLGGTHVCTFEEMIVDCPRATARYMVKNNVGRRYKGLNGIKPHWDWATKFSRESERIIRRLKRFECSYREDTPSEPSVGRIRLMQGKKRKRAGKKRKTLIQYKYGIRVPANAKEAYELDELNRNTLWGDAIKKELDAIMAYETFQFLDDGAASKVRKDSEYQFAKVWLIFDVKQDLRRKARLVIGGHMVDPRGNDVYASHMRAESARILMTIADANGLNVAVGDISNAYLYADTAEKIYTTCGEEFKRSGLIEESGRTALVVKALYGLSGSAHQWWDMLSDTLRAMKFKRSRGDQDVWLRANGDKYDYIGTHTDDLLVVSKDVDQIFDELRKEYSFKTTDAPEYHLGIDYIMKDGRYQLGSKTYVKEALKRVCDALGLDDLEELGESKFPLNNSYRPEEDTSPLLDPDQHRVFQQLVGIGVWLVAIGRFDVGFTVSSLSRFSAYPREGHLEEVIRMYRYINRIQDRKILVDGRDQEEIGEVLCTDADFRQQYPDIVDELNGVYYPRDFPKPLGMVPMTTGIYFDADHAHDRVTGRSITGMVVYVGRTPTTWSSRRQGSVENSTYGAEFIAGKNATEEAIGLRYVLLSLGVPLKGPTILYGDNKSMIQSSSLPEGQVKKKHVMLAWHKVRETHAASITQCRWVATHLNKSNLLTKALPGTTLHKEASMIWC